MLDLHTLNQLLGHPAFGTLWETVILGQLVVSPVKQGWSLKPGFRVVNPDELVATLENKGKEPAV